MTVLVPEKARTLSGQTFSVRGSGPQGLRRPRFSFFRFTCQTAGALRLRFSDTSPLRKEVGRDGEAVEVRTSDMAIRSWPDVTV